ncbi:unnamed protein product [Leptidea sinapis]|uniref:Uncharacterized protein n=1 Tax=Leptidea sinapis TaxID=189913 RepID=A0A5E4PSB1_9NEOP|nr:unnamed protein product [Leptidea sinapis]
MYCYQPANDIGFSIVFEFLISTPKNDQDKNQLVLAESSTIAKDPIYPKSNVKYLTKLKELQRFNCKKWNSVRFAEEQKKYVTTLGFVELEINDEFKRFGSQSTEEYRQYLLERSFSAMTNALLTQKDELGLREDEILKWRNESDGENELVPPTHSSGDFSSDGDENGSDTIPIQDENTSSSDEEPVNLSTPSHPPVATTVGRGRASLRGSGKVATSISAL